MIKEIYLAGGCFWGVEGYFAQLNGVIETKVGYSNGLTEDTNYKLIKSTDHAEDVYKRQPEGGIGGGTILDECTPEKLIENKQSYTGKFLKNIL